MKKKSIQISSLLLILTVIFSSCQKQMDISLQSSSVPEQNVITSNSEKASVNLENGLVAFYPFTGNAKDASGKGNNGIANGVTLTTDRNGKGKSAYSFNGLAISNNTIIVKDNVITVPNFNLNFNNKITISLWALTYPTNYGDFLQRRTDNNIDFAVSNYAGVDGTTPGPTQIGAHFGALGTLRGSTLISYNTWHNYTYLYDGTTMKLYIDGILDAQKSITGVISNNTAELNIGKYIYHGGFTHYFFYNGKMDDIRFYNRVLNESEIIYIAKH